MITKPLISTVVILIVLLLANCSEKKIAENDFSVFLIKEIGKLGGHTNRLSCSTDLQGEWSFNRDRLGLAIDTVGITFEAITNFLTSAYGEPLFYARSNVRHGPIFLYPPRNTGIAIFVCKTELGAEVTLTKTQ